MIFRREDTRSGMSMPKGASGRNLSDPQDLLCPLLKSPPVTWRTLPQSQRHSNTPPASSVAPGAPHYEKPIEALAGQVDQG
jgi:hypothetical protein